jgi:hypothetical protein
MEENMSVKISSKYRAPIKIQNAFLSGAYFPDSDNNSLIVTCENFFRAKLMRQFRNFSRNVSVFTEAIAL